MSKECQKCGVSRPRLQKDRKIPRWKFKQGLAEGNPNDPSNIWYLCANCHEDKTIEDLKDYRHSPETKRNISLGIRNSSIHNKHVAEANKRRAGRTHSVETKRRMSDAAHERWARQNGTPPEVIEAKKLLKTWKESSS